MVLDEAESSSTDIDDLSDNSNHGNPSTSQTKESIPSTSQTNLNNNDNNEELSAIFPIPSTSTGFRGNGKHRYNFTEIFGLAIGKHPFDPILTLPFLKVHCIV